MDDNHSDRWIVGFLYRLSTISGVLLLLLYMLWWLASVTVGVMSAASPGWGVTQWIVAILVVGGSVNGFDELIEKACTAWRDWDWVNRLARMAAVAGIAYWLGWLADWEKIAINLRSDFSGWSIEWDTVIGMLIGAIVAIVLLMSGRLALVCALYIWRFIFWLITGERWDSKRAGLSPWGTNSQSNSRA